MFWNVYTAPAFDHGWEYLRTVREVREDLAKNPPIGSEARLYDHEELVALDKFNDSWRSAKAAALHVGWEGDFRNGVEPRVFALPIFGEVTLCEGFVFKQDNNGITFFVSPGRLPWLEGRGQDIETTDVFVYKGTRGIAILDFEAAVYKGYVIDDYYGDQVSFEGESVEEAEQAFRQAVDAWNEAAKRAMDEELAF
ncbi:hypothetical protein [Geopseudomonas aromaticivorans]